MTDHSAPARPVPVLVHRIVIEDASIRDISQFGLAVETATPLTIGHNYVFALVSNQATVLLDGEVVRSELAAIRQDGEGGPSLYHSGISFRIERNPKEMALLGILQDNLFGEKRFGGGRIQPIRPIRTHIARADIGRITQLSHQGMTLLTDALSDPDDAWQLLLENASGHIQVDARIVQGSKRADRDLYETRLEFLDPGPEAASFLKKSAQMET